MTADPWMRLPTLNDENYRRWSSSVRAYLRAKRLWPIVSGELKLQHAKDTDEWWVENGAASSILIASVDDTQLEHIADFEFASEQWETLYKIHELPQKPSVLAILQYFFTFDAGSMTVDEAAAELNKVQAEIRRYFPKDTPSDLAKAIVLMNAVDPSYDGVNTAILNENDVTYEMCVNRLRGCEMARNQGGSESDKTSHTDQQEKSNAKPTRGQEARVNEPSGRSSPSGSRINPLANPFHPTVATKESSDGRTESMEDARDEGTEKDSSENKTTAFDRFKIPSRQSPDIKGFAFQFPIRTQEGTGSSERKPRSLDRVSQDDASTQVEATRRSIRRKNVDRSQSSNRTTTNNSTANSHSNSHSNNNSTSTSTLKFRKGREPCTLCGKRSHDPEDCWHKEKGGARQSSAKKNNNNNNGKGAAAKGSGGSTTSRKNGHRGSGEEAGEASDGSIDTVSWRQGWLKQREKKNEDDDEKNAEPVSRPGEPELISW